MRDFLIAGNWKMNASSAANAELTDGILAGMPQSDSVKLLICPPYPYLPELAQKLAGSNLAIGAQNVSQHQSGAYTGEVSPGMLADIACEYAIVGHSERRAMMGECSDIVAAKFVAALGAGLKPILCIGETLEEREADRTEAIIDEQLTAVLDLAGVESFSNAVVAYEPVWAIGTGRTATPELAEKVHFLIRSWLSDHSSVGVADQVRILYGGSVTPENAGQLIEQENIDGFLVGGASLDAQSFAKIVQQSA